MGDKKQYDTLVLPQPSGRGPIENCVDFSRNCSLLFQLWLKPKFYLQFSSALKSGATQKAVIYFIPSQTGVWEGDVEFEFSTLIPKLQFGDAS